MWEVTKWARALRTHGFRKTISDWWTVGDIKVGRLVGSDSLGNKYYQNTDEVVWGRDRWVDYSNRFYPREASYVPPEWHAWLHRMSDVVPGSEREGEYYAKKPFFVWSEHRANMTGTDGAYKPYNTTKPKIESWTGIKNEQ